MFQKQINQRFVYEQIISKNFIFVIIKLKKHKTIKDFLSKFFF